jgi:hypothetical protein
MTVLEDDGHVWSSTRRLIRRTRSGRLPGWLTMEVNRMLVEYTYLLWTCQSRRTSPHIRSPHLQRWSFKSLLVNLRGLRYDLSEAPAPKVSCHPTPVLRHPISTGFPKRRFVFLQAIQGNKSGEVVSRLPYNTVNNNMSISNEALRKVRRRS